MHPPAPPQRPPTDRPRGAIRVPGRPGRPSVHVDALPFPSSAPPRDVPSHRPSCPFRHTAPLYCRSFAHIPISRSALSTALRRPCRPQLVAPLRYSALSAADHRPVFHASMGPDLPRHVRAFPASKPPDPQRTLQRSALLCLRACTKTQRTSHAPWQSRRLTSATHEPPTPHAPVRCR
jgi:hypothetical protein